MSLSMADNLVFDNLDPVDAVLKTDDTFEHALAVATTAEDGVIDADKAINTLEESGEILDARVDLSDVMVNESSFDSSSVIDICIMEEFDGEEAEPDVTDDEEEFPDMDVPDDEELYEDDDDGYGDMIDEVDAGDTEPDTQDDAGEGAMIDAIDADAADNTGYQIEEVFGFGSSVFYEDANDDAADIADEDDEAINEKNCSGGRKKAVTEEDDIYDDYDDDLED